MDNVYTLNPYPLPEKPKTPEQHAKLMGLYVAIVVLVVICAVAYFWSTYERTRSAAKNIAPIDHQAELQTAMATFLQSKEAEASTEEINNMAAILQKTKASPSKVSSADMATILNKTSK